MPANKSPSSTQKSQDKNTTEKKESYTDIKGTIFQQQDSKQEKKKESKRLKPLSDKELMDLLDLEEQFLPSLDCFFY